MNRRSEQPNNAIGVESEVMPKRLRKSAKIMEQIQVLLSPSDQVVTREMRETARDLRMALTDMIIKERGNPMNMLDTFYVDVTRFIDRGLRPEVVTNKRKASIKTV